MKCWKKRVGPEVIDQTLEAARQYRAEIPTIVALNGFEASIYEHQQALLSRGIKLQLWDRVELIRRSAALPPVNPARPDLREYQETAVQSLLRAHKDALNRMGLIVMATGLGKTVTMAEFYRRLNEERPQKTLVLAHTNEIVYQLERAFWPFLAGDQETLVWNGIESPPEAEIDRCGLIFACVNSVFEHVQKGRELPAFDLVVVDECHHVGGDMYGRVLAETRAGKSGGPFLAGMTATPWRADEVDPQNIFGPPLLTMDMVTGLRQGFLSNVDYRMYTDNIDWDSIAKLRGAKFSPKEINRTLFISEWDDAVIRQLQEAWKEQEKPRAIVFCGTIDHAITMRDRINAYGFCNAKAIYSRTSSGHVMDVVERNRVLSDFHDGEVQAVCAIDIFNEGVDVPDVNIIVFQRVTHSRRIFVQQLGRGLRLAPGKRSVIVLDFVSDIRRFAAGLQLKQQLDEHSDGPAPGKPHRINVNHTVSFRKAGGEDPQAENFLKLWLQDVGKVESSGEDASVLQFPPALPGGRD